MMEAEVTNEIYPVEGMHCAACASTVQKSLEQAPGVREATVNFATNTAQISFDEAEVGFESLQKAVSDVGYTLKEKTEETDFDNAGAGPQKIKKQFLFALGFSSIVFVLSMFVGDFTFKNYILLALSTPVLVWSGGQFFVRAWKQLKLLKTNMDTLIAFGTGSAFLFSLFNTAFPQVLEDYGVGGHVYYESAVVIITFILLGKWLEERAKHSSSNAIAKLYQLQVKRVTLIDGDEQREVEVDELKIGDIVLVRPGEKVPVDGTVIAGQSNVDESLVTGESKPVFKAKRGSVIAGTMNLDGALEVFVHKTGEETLLSSIIQLVRQAQATKAPAQQLADRIAAVFVPIVLLLALATFLVWQFLGPDPATIYAFVNTFSVLIIACPCALGLATPMAIMVSVGKGARYGMLIKNATAIEASSQIDTLFLDKTGTISEGKMKVQTFDSYFEEDETLLYLSILFGIENKSVHPIAKAVNAYLEETYALIPFNIETIKDIPGVGVQATVEEDQYTVVGERGLKELDLTKEQEQRISEALKAGMTMVAFAKGNKLLALILLNDTVKKESVELIRKLRQRNINVVMLSGDNEAICAQVAYEVGIDDYHAGLLPEDKLTLIRKAQEQGARVAFAGDGVNDAPALAGADIGIAMSTGTDVALESADVTLMRGDIGKISALINLSHATRATMKQNLFWAFTYNVVAIPIAAGILFPVNGFLLNPMIAGAAMAFSSLSVVLNSLRLKNKRI